MRRDTLTPQDLHPEGGVGVPGLDVHPEEARPHRVLQVGHLHAVAVRVTTEHLSQGRSDKWRSGQIRPV